MEAFLKICIEILSTVNIYCNIYNVHSIKCSIKWIHNLVFLNDNNTA